MPGLRVDQLHILAFLLCIGKGRGTYAKATGRFVKKPKRMLARPASAAVAVMRSCFTTIPRALLACFMSREMFQEDGMFTVRADQIICLICTCASYAKWFLTLTRSTSFGEDVGLGGCCQYHNEGSLH